MNNILKIPLNKIRQEGNYKELLDAIEKDSTDSVLTFTLWERLPGMYG